VGVEANAYQYNGKELNEDFGLNYSHQEYRWLNLQTNSWTSIDPLTEKNHHVSAYSFVHNNPIRYRDPYGLDTLPTIVITAPRKTEQGIKSSSFNHIQLGMIAGHRSMLAKTGGHYNPISFGTRIPSGTYAYQEGLGILSYPIMATLGAVAAAFYTPALPPLLEQQSIGVMSAKFISSGLVQGLVNKEIDVVDLLGDTFLTPFYSGLVGGLGDYAFQLNGGEKRIEYWGFGGSKSSTNFLLDFGFSYGVGLSHTASESMFKSFANINKKMQAPLYYFGVTSPAMSTLNYGGNWISKETVKEGR
ncbi:MAG TPA: RHS repeat-associated core domain-containing protein, partial [Chitinophagales bacterium]|nr:RHS repeat-associated core domain-containing protein [Chitinophagales bacterium]